MVRRFVLERVLMNNIPEIHDIHIPESVSIFPLAYGWWIILGAVAGLFVLYKVILWSVKTSKKLYALKKLKKLENEKPIIAAVQMSELLRRICALKYKEASVLYGDEWISFLNSHTKYKLSEKAASLLVYAPFMNPNDTLYDFQTVLDLKEFCKQWIGANL